jgi:hypothetical protein
MAVREVCHRLEETSAREDSAADRVAGGFWTLPKYSEMLFLVRTAARYFSGE